MDKEKHEHTQTHTVDREKKTLTKGNTLIVRKSERLHMCADCRKGRIQANKLNITYNSARLRENSRNNWYLEQDTILDEYFGAKKTHFFPSLLLISMLKIVCAHRWNTASFISIHRLTAISCALHIRSLRLFFPRSFALFSLTHNLCRVKYVWKKRYSFLFFKLYCTKNVNSENATTSNDQHTDTQTHKRCTLRHMKSAMWLIIIYI